LSTKVVTKKTLRIRRQSNHLKIKYNSSFSAENVHTFGYLQNSNPLSSDNARVKQKWLCVKTANSRIKLSSCISWHILFFGIYVSFVDG